MAKTAHKPSTVAKKTENVATKKNQVTTTTVATNGTAKAKKVDKETPIEEKEMNNIQVPTVIHPPQAKFSLLERIERVKLLDGLANKRARVVDTLSELRQFQFSANDSCALELTDSTGREFHTSNSNLIGLLTDNLEGLLQDKVKELDAQIIDFEL